MSSEIIFSESIVDGSGPVASSAKVCVEKKNNVKRVNNMVFIEFLSLV